MRIAAISDVHDNIEALEAVLEDITHRGVDVIVNLGDILSGPLFPVDCAESINSGFGRLVGHCARTPSPALDRRIDTDMIVYR